VNYKTETDLKTTERILTEESFLRLLEILTGLHQATLVQLSNREAVDHVTPSLPTLPLREPSLSRLENHTRDSLSSRSLTVEVGMPPNTSTTTDVMEDTCLKSGGTRETTVPCLMLSIHMSQDRLHKNKLARMIQASMLPRSQNGDQSLVELPMPSRSFVPDHWLLQ